MRDTNRVPTRISDGLCSIEGGDAGAGGAGGAAGGAGAAGAGAADGGAGASDAAFYEAFTNADLRTHPSIVGKYKSAEELAHGYVSLEKRFGVDPARRLDLPADPADKDAMRAVFQRLGTPEKPDGYGLKLADGATEADKAFLDRALPALHGANLTNDQAKAVFEYWQGEVKSAGEAAAAADAARMSEGKGALQKAWGADYERRGKEIGAMLTRHGSPGLAAELDSFDKLGNHPELALFLGDVLDAIAEPGEGGGGDAARGDALLTPAQAMAEVRRLEGDPLQGAALRDAGHPMHKAVVAERARLLAMTEPA